MAENTVKNKLAEMSFEQALEKLEKLVEKMEEGNLPLDKMIDCFEQGTALSSFCRQKLDNLEKKIELLVREDAQGGKWTEFDAGSPRKDAGLSVAGEEAGQSAKEPSGKDSGDMLF